MQDFFWYVWTTSLRCCVGTQSIPDSLLVEVQEVLLLVVAQYAVRPVSWPWIPLLGKLSLDWEFPQSLGEKF